MYKDDQAAVEADFIPFSELLLLSLEQRAGRLCDAAEAVVKTTAKGAANIEALTAQITRLADALDAVSNTLACVTESVQGEDGVDRCFVRTVDRSNHAYVLANRNDLEDED